MKLGWLSALVVMCGCWTTHPYSDLMDCMKPGKMYKDRVTPYGGVCIPNQGVTAAPIPGTPPSR